MQKQVRVYLYVPRARSGGAGAAVACEERACTIRTPAASDVTAHGWRKRATATSEPTGDGRVGSGGAVFAAEPRRFHPIALQTVTPRGGAHLRPVDRAEGVQVASRAQ